MKRVQVLIDYWQLEYARSFDYIPMGEIVRAGLCYLALKHGKKPFEKGYIDGKLAYEARKKIEG